MKSKSNLLSSAACQIDVLENRNGQFKNITTFQQKLEQSGLYPLKPLQPEIFQVNIGKMCNQTCRHCHVDAGPDRKEIMTKETMQQCLDFLKNSTVETVDITGGAPEMNPEFRWFVEECFKLGKNILVRCNLTIIVANKKYNDLPQFFADHKVQVISSLPFYNADRTDRQRGKGVFADSVKALHLLNDVGYGREGSGLILNLVYNPSGAFLPGSQEELEVQFKKVLKSEFNIDFNNLYTITNLPVSRFLEYLLDSDNYDAYMEKLVNAYNPLAAAGVMCRNTLSIGWDGYIYDCDFNQMLDLKVKVNGKHISSVEINELNNREIQVNQHCYGCTAGAGSSCGGATV
ncbi:MAG: arsenosugar biosynthesis radical SAM (seleno)protein ArsS [Cytophagaceae bacterium]